MAKELMEYEPRCTICRFQKRSPGFSKRLWDSRPITHNQKADSLAKIAKEFEIPYINLVRHVDKHMKKNTDAIAARRLESIARKHEKLEAKAQVMEYNAGQDAPRVWDDVIELGKQKLQEGEMKLTANHLLKAAKDKTDFEIKKKNQDMALMEMMWHFASGEAVGSDEIDRGFIQGETTDDYNAAEFTAAAFTEGETRPSTVRDRATGDATAPRTDTVFEGDDF